MPTVSTTRGREYKEWLGAPRPFSAFRQSKSRAWQLHSLGRRPDWMFRGTRVSIRHLVSALSVLTSAMPKYVIERDVPGAGDLSDVQLRELSQKSLAAIHSLGHDIQWLHSYVTGDKVYCVYLAADESVVREHAKRAGIPANRISAVRRLLDASAAE
jgi:hypothetical protein